jgi:hypothetical protein
MADAVIEAKNSSCGCGIVSIPGGIVYKSKKERPLTVCIAAICAPGIILGAADQMKTAGDI